MSERQHEAELRRLNRALRMLSDSNQSLIRIADEATLLRETCRIAVEVGGYRMAWVGFPEDDERKSIRVGAAVGVEEGYLEAMQIVWADVPRGRGPAGTALRTGQMRVVHDVRTDPSTAPWREAARERGYEAVASLPLICDGRTLGVFSVYANETEAFDAEENKILMEVAGDLAFGLTALRTRAEHARAEELLHRREQEFRAFVENSPDLILRFDREFRETYVNPAMCRTFGLPAEAFLNKRVGAGSRAAGLETNSHALNKIQRCIESVFVSGEPVELEAQWPTPGGERVYSVRYFPEFNRDGPVSSVLAIARDITELRHAEHALTKVLRHARSIVMRALVRAPAGWEQHGVEWAVAHFHWEMRFEDEASAQAVLPLALSPGERYDHGWNRAKHRDDLGPMGLIGHGALLAGATSWTQEFRAFDRDGRLHWFAQVASIEQAGDGRWRVTTVNTDITVLKRAEQEQAAHLRFFENLDRVNRAIQGAVGLEQMMSEVLDLLLEIFDCDRAWLTYPCDPEAAAWHVPMERTRPEYPGALVLRVEVPMDATVAAVLQRLLDARGPVKFGPGLAQPVPELIAREFAVKTILAMPLFPKGDRPYAFGLHQCSREREWSAEEEKLFREIGHRMADALTGLLARRDQQESEQKFRTLAENTPDFIVRWDREQRRVYVNPAFAEGMGTKSEQLVGGAVGKKFKTPAPPRSVDLVRETITRVFAEGEPAEILIPWTTVAGESFHYIRFIPELDRDGKIATVLGIGRDVTALKESEEQLRALTDNSPDLIARVDREHRYVYVNRAIEGFTGMPAEQHLGKRLGEVSAAQSSNAALTEAVASVHEAIDRVFANGSPTELEQRMHLPRRNLILDGRFVPEFNQSGEVATVLIIARDVTERKFAEEALRHSQQAYASLVTTIDGIVWEADATTFLFTFVSPQVERILGYTPGQWVGVPNFWSEHLHPDDRDEAVTFCVTATQQMRDHDFRYRILAADGRAVWVHDFVTVVAENGRAVKLRGILLDITQSKRSEEALLLFRTLIDHTTDAIEVIDPATSRFLDVNETACRTHGYTRAEFLALSVPDVETKLDLGTPERWKNNIAEIRRAGSRIIEGEHRRKDGSTFPVEINANYVHLDRDYLVSIVRDITERKHAEAALRESEHRFRQVTESIDEVFWLTDTDKNRMVYISPAYEKIWGRSCESLYASPHSWIEAIHSGDRERVLTALGLQASGGYDVEYRILRPDRTERWIHDRAFPIKDAEERVSRIAGVAKDITVSRQLEDQVRQSQKLEAVGQLAGGIAHDFNNLLTIIQMQSSLLLSDNRESYAARTGLQQIMDAASRGANLTRQLLTFSRRQAKEARKVDLGEIVGAMTNLLRRILGEDIVVESRIAPALPAVHADPGMMEQVLMNLVVNARDAMPHGGTLIVGLDAMTVDAGNVAAHPRARPGRFLRLEVKDTGTGISAEVLPRIFEPFFTTKEVGKGTGLGLATVFGIVEQHNGWIEVKSEPGQGTTFRVFLPALANSKPLAVDNGGASGVNGGNEIILIVEDELIVRAIAAAALRRHGYNVLEAGSAAEAHKCWDEANGNVDLLLTDIVIPGGIGGHELADQLRERRPGLKTIFTTGYSKDLVTRRLKVEVGRDYLPKPYSFGDLAAIVRRRLDEK